MSKVAIAEAATAPVIDTPAEFDGSSETRAFFKAGKDPVQVYQNRLDAGGSMRLGPSADDSVTFVWNGDVEVAGRAMPQGSSLVIESGGSAEVKASGPAVLLTFSGTHAERTASARVHLLPRERVPYAQDLGHDSRVGGGMHANAEQPVTSLWLHENNFPPTDVAPPLDQEAGVHCHTEDEVIFVVDGQIQLGQRLYGPGTAVGIAANTYYSFQPGPNGLRFINFRPGRPNEIRMRNGYAIDEIAYWKDRLPVPEHVTLEAART